MSETPKQTESEAGRREASGVERLVNGHPYYWSELLRKKYDACPGHDVLIRNDGTESICEECSKPICRKCGLCFDR